MTRVKRGVLVRRRHKRLLKLAKGYYSSRSRVFCSAKQTVIKAGQYAYRDRRRKRREYRQNWIRLINSRLGFDNLSYNKFIFFLKKSGILLNRKILSSDVCISDKNFLFLLSILHCKK